LIAASASCFVIRVVRPAAMSAAAAILVEIHELPRARLRRMAVERRQIPDTVWQQATGRLIEAAGKTGFPLRVQVLYWTCVSQVEEAVGEVPTDVAIVQAVHGMAAARLLAERLDDQTAAVLEGPYWRALG